MDIEAKANLESRPCRNEQQKERLNEDKKLIGKRPHNIRSIKGAFQDFQRIYRILMEYPVGDAYHWLWSFLSFSMAAKANLIHRDDKYEYIFRDQTMELLYPGYYDSRFFPDCLVYWIIEGKWDEEALREYIKKHYPTEREKPSSLVKNTRIDWLEEEIAQSGMNEVIEQAYCGDLSYNEYVMLIVNIKLAREYKLNINVVDWNKIKEAIQQKIKNDINTDDYKAEYTRDVIEQLDGFTTEEKSTYEIISVMRDKRIITQERQRKEYIDLMCDNQEQALIMLRYRKLRYFDTEMAEATLKGYTKAENIIQAKFDGVFEDAWSGYKERIDISKEEIRKTNDGLKKLKEGLIELSQTYEQKPFKKRFTNAFIDTITQLMGNEHS